MDRGIILSDEIHDKLRKRLEENYQKAYQKAIKDNKKDIEKLTKTKDKKEARELFMKISQKQGLINNLADEIASAGETAKNIIQGELINLYGLNYNFACYEIQKQMGFNVNFSQYDRNQIAIILKNSESPFTKIAYKNLGQDKAIVKTLQNELLQALLLGEAQDKLIKRISKVTSASATRAKRIAQTERNRVQSEARMNSIKEAETLGIDMHKQWISRLRNTRELHLLTHLEKKPSKEVFSNGLMYPGDFNGSAQNVINCFCVLKPVVLDVPESFKREEEQFDRISFDRFMQKKKEGKL